jgi:SAM-dependent methyltransferase
VIINTQQLSNKQRISGVHTSTFVQESTYKFGKCKICRSDDYSLIGKPRIYKSFPRAAAHNYSIAQCRRCDFYFIDPAIDLSQEEWETLYTANYFGQGQPTEWQLRLRQREFRERMAYICGHLEHGKGRFLDIGCGQGHMLSEAGLNGFEPYGVDIANNLAPGLHGKYEFINGNILDAKFPDGFFSAVYMDSVLEHVPDPYETMKELKRILQPGGVIMVIVPNEDSMMNSFIKWCYYLTFNRKKYGKIKPFINPYHIHGFNRRSLKHLFNDLSLKTLFIKDFGGRYTFWKAQPRHSKQYFIELFSYPVGLLSCLTGSQVQLMALLKK